MNIGSRPGHRKRDPRPGLRVPLALVIQVTLAFLLYLFPTEVRLVDGRSRCQGRVEIFYNRTWGTVCDDDWDVVDANVVCRQLGCGHAIAMPATLFFGQGRGPILLDNVDCTGREPSLSACGSLGWGVHNCYHYEDVAVTCNELIPTLAGGSTSKTTATSFHNGKRDGSVRLVGGANSCQGRVEIFYQGHWGTVCDDDWGMSDVGVVCRQVGCGHATDYRTNAYFGHGTGHILLDNVHCDGSEPRLSSCYSLGWGIHNCGHHEDAGAICSGLGMTTITAATPSGAHSYEEPFTNTATATGSRDLDSPETEMAITSPRLLRGKRSGGVRLASGNSSCQGRVEVQFRGAWGTVCDDDWGFPDAQVVCRQVGCGAAVAPTVLGSFGYGAGPILLDNVACAGSEARLADCFHLGWGQHNCGHHEDAGVICRGAGDSGNFFSDDISMTTTSTTTRPKDGSLRLVNGSHRCEGRVEMFYLSQWGTVCDDAWDLADVKVVCRQLGCGGALAASGEARYGRGAGYIFLDNLKCTGSEPSLLRCSHIRWNVHNCDHSEDAGARCSLL